jgi:hypothetical protein
MSGLWVRASLRRHRFHHRAIAEILGLEGTVMADPKIKICTVAHVAPALQQEWLQHLRDFDAAHPGCHFEVGIDAPTESLGEMVERMRIEPELTFLEIFQRQAKGGERGSVDEQECVLRAVRPGHGDADSG